MQVRAIRVSRDGARLAVVVDADGAVQVLVHAITVDADGTPTGLGPPLPVGRELTDATDMVSVDETQLAVPGVSEPATTAHVAEAGGPTTPPPSVPATVGGAAGR